MYFESRKSTYLSRLISLAALIALCLLLPTRAQAQQAPVIQDQYKVKLAFVYSISNYSTNTRAGNDKSYVIGVFGKDPFGKLLDRVAKKKKVRKAQIKIHRFDKAKDYQDCDIIFVKSGTDPDEVAKLFAKLKGKSVMIVGEQMGFTQAGGVLNFYIKQNGQIGIQIDINNMKNHKLKVDARLLKLCDVVNKPQQQNAQ